jgi:RimJ/RimL family protein N-acetyltransferase
MLSGKTIKLVPLDKSDLELSRAWANDPSLNQDILRVLPVAQEDQERWYRSILEDQSKIVFAIKTTKDGEHIGNTGFYCIDWIHRRAQFWILIGQKGFWNQGVGAEATSLMVKYGFRHLNLAKIHLHVSENNERALRLYRKLNFITEGRMREHYFIDGRYVNVLIMSILRRDYGLGE